MQNLGYKFYSYLCSCVCIFLVFLGGCGGNPSIPDAPPPYHTYSTPGYTPTTNTDSYPTQPPYAPANQWDRQYENPGVSPTSPSPFKQQEFYAPPPLQNSQPSLNSRYTITAKANIWVLVQDEFGTEIDWKKLSKGETMPITHPRPVTITCSSGSKVQIVDEKGKEVNPPSNASGIAIVRLP